MKFSFKYHPEIEWLKEPSQSSCFYFCCVAASFNKLVQRTLHYAAVNMLSFHCSIFSAAPFRATDQGVRLIN